MHQLGSSLLPKYSSILSETWHQYPCRHVAWKYQSCFASCRMEKNESSRYLRAQKSSFNTKIALFMFQAALDGKEDLSETAFQSFNIEADLVHTYTARYWQQGHDEKVAGSPFTVKELYHRMQSLKQKYAPEVVNWEKNYAFTFKSLFPEDDFLNLFKDPKCAY
jgi:arabinogalactan endo-1,4-beta-galactosidase